MLLILSDHLQVLFSEAFWLSEVQIVFSVVVDVADQLLDFCAFLSFNEGRFCAVFVLIIDEAKLQCSDFLSLERLRNNS